MEHLYVFVGRTPPPPPINFVHDHLYNLQSNLAFYIAALSYIFWFISHSWYWYSERNNGSKLFYLKEPLSLQLLLNLLLSNQYVISVAVFCSLKYMLSKKYGQNMLREFYFFTN